MHWEQVEEQEGIRRLVQHSSMWNFSWNAFSKGEQQREGQLLVCGTFCVHQGAEGSVGHAEGYPTVNAV